MENHFVTAIKQYCDKRAAEDSLFWERYNNEKKSIEECCEYIVSAVKQTGRCGFADDEIYNLAVHYYDEDNIVFNKENPESYKVVVNTEIQLSESEKEKARQDAMKRIEEEEYSKIKSQKKEANDHIKKMTKRTPEKAEAVTVNQLDLF